MQMIFCRRRAWAQIEIGRKAPWHRINSVLFPKPCYWIPYLTREAENWIPRVIILKLGVYQNPQKGLLKHRWLILSVWGGPKNFTFWTSSQVILMLPTWDHIWNHCAGTSLSVSTESIWKSTDLLGKNTILHKAV